MLSSHSENQLVINKNTKWPFLAWLLTYDIQNRATEATVGPLVETFSNGFVEGVWDGEYSDFRFGETRNFLGSGVTCDNGLLRIHSSGVPIDRIHYYKDYTKVLVSNSLACLLSALGNDRFDVSNWGSICYNTVTGIDHYCRQVCVCGKTINLIYCRDMHINKYGNIELLEKPPTAVSLNNFHSYRDYLKNTLHLIFNNANAKERSKRYGFSAGISSGYDSATIAALCGHELLPRVFSINESWNNLNDSGEPIARALGIEVDNISRYEWLNTNAECEAFLAVGDGIISGIELMGAKKYLRGKVFLAGWLGDAVWWVKAKKGELDRYARIQHNGLSYTEWRLHLPFFNVPVPYIGLDRIEEIINISKSSDMDPWNIALGPDHDNEPYSRPICRRICEEAGIPRNTFGLSKKAIMTTNGDRRHHLKPVFQMFNRESLNRLCLFEMCLMDLICRFFVVLLVPLRELGNTHFRGTSRIRVVEQRLRNWARTKQYGQYNWSKWGIERITKMYR